jgi:hypothetical protein
MLTLENSRAELANKALHFFRQYGDSIKHLDRELTEDVDEMVALGKQMADDQEEFMQAVAGRPSRKAQV